jgi:oxygen-dependent protoporphyrinogen oxidase
MNQNNIVIIGAGISGLTRAYFLTKKGFNVTVLESRDVVGGSMRTIKKDGYLIDFGPNSGLETTPLIKQMVDELGLSEQFIYADEVGNNRYILKKGELLPLPTGGGAFLKSELFSTKAKLRLMAEPFIGKSDDGYYQSISEFVTRRLGHEFLDYAIDPFVSGVYAGDPSKLSVKSAFPKLYRLEELYGGLIKGMIKGAKERKARNEESKQSAKMFSFKDGMQVLPNAIAEYLGDKVKLNANVDKVLKSENGYKVRFNVNGVPAEIETDEVISAVPSYTAAKIFNEIDPNLAAHLNGIFYPSVMVIYLGYDKLKISRNLDGFGFLIPGKEKRNFLGAIWSSTIFPNRAPKGKAGFTIFVGGAKRQDYNWNKPDLIIAEVLSQFERIMKITGSPELVEYNIWKHAIPQYNIGYIEHENYFLRFEKANPGLHLTANFRGGISVGDCVKSNGELIIDNGE